LDSTCTCQCPDPAMTCGATCCSGDLRCNPNTVKCDCSSMGGQQCKTSNTCCGATNNPCCPGSANQCKNGGCCLTGTVCGATPGTCDYPNGTLAGAVQCNDN
jgi:hypothetical protein